MTTHRPQGGGHPGEPDIGGPRDHVRARAPRDIRDEVRRRAALETNNNKSRLIVRCLRYALFSSHRMPPGWTPEEDQARSAS